MPGSTTNDQQRNQWFVENYDGKENTEPIKISTSLKEGVYIGNCKGGVFMVDTKTKSLAISNSSNIGVVCGDVIAQLTIVNCKKIQVQTTGHVPIIQCDKSERVTIYLSQDCLDSDPPTTILSSATQGVNIVSPQKGNEEGDMDENPLPEAIKSTFENGKFVSTVVVAGQE